MTLKLPDCQFGFWITKLLKNTLHWLLKFRIDVMVYFKSEKHTTLFGKCVFSSCQYTFITDWITHVKLQTSIDNNVNYHSVDLMTNKLLPTNSGLLMANIVELCLTAKKMLRSSMIETTLLCVNGRSLPWAVRERFDMKPTSTIGLIEQLMNSAIAENCYLSVSCRLVFRRSLIGLLAADKS